MSPTLLDLIARVDNVPLDFSANHAPYYRLFVSPSSHPQGYIHPHTLSSLAWPGSFSVDHASRTVTLTTNPSSPTAINAALDQVVQSALSSPLYPSLSIPSEPFLITGLSLPSSNPPVQVQRFASSLFGIATRGAHLTAYLTNPLRIWVARRSAHLKAHPSLLDSSIAGGVKASNTPWECILAESFEEASLPASLVESHAVATGAVTLANRNAKTDLFHAETLYTYDMHLSEDVKLVPGDEEVEEFVLMDCEEVIRRMRDGEFKPNVCLVMIDFLIRHGVVTPENEVDYVDICSRLHRVLPMPTRPAT